MSHAYELAATRILDHLHRAETEILLRPVVTFNGEAGTVLAVRLDEAHGLCFTFDMPATGFALQYEGESRRFYPVSTIKLLGPRS